MVKSSRRVEYLTPAFAGFEPDDADCNQWVEATGKYHPQAWSPELGNACYAIEHTDGTSRMMFIFQAEDASRSEGKEWVREYRASDSSGYYSIAEVTATEFAVLKPAFVHGIPIFVEVMLKRYESESFAPIKSIDFINDATFVNGMLHIFSVRDKTNEDLKAAQEA